MSTVTFLVFLLGCNPSPPESAQNALTLQLNWLPDAQHGGFFAALNEGHFRSQGLNVQLLSGGPGTPSITKLATGRCDFAIGNADQVLLSRQQGADVVAVFAAMQDSPRCIMVHEKSGIESLEQLRDITLAIGDGKAFAEYMKIKLPLDGVRIVSYSGTVAKFLLDDQFAQQGYVFSEPILAANQGGDPKPLMVSELGFNPYSSVLLVRQETCEKEPELVRKVVTAVRAGWTSYLENSELTNAEIVKVNEDMDAETLQASSVSIKPLCMPQPDTVLGSMTSERWSLLREQLIEIELLPSTAPAANEAFRTEFLSAP